MAKRRKRTNRDVPAKGRLKEMADRLWGKAVLTDALYICAVCGKYKATDAHHLIPRAHYATRFDLQNGLALCSQHHVWDADTSPHQNAAGFIRWLNYHHPERYEWLMDTLASCSHNEFPPSGKTANYFCDQIRRLREYVDEEDYERIVGVRFGAWLQKRLPKRA